MVNNLNKNNQEEKENWGEHMQEGELSGPFGEIEASDTAVQKQDIIVDTRTPVNPFAETVIADAIPSDRTSYESTPDILIEKKGWETSTLEDHVSEKNILASERAERISEDNVFAVIKTLDLDVFLRNDGALNGPASKNAISDKIGDVFDLVNENFDKEKIQNKLSDIVFGSISLFINQENNLKNLEILQAVLIDLTRGYMLKDLPSIKLRFNKIVSKRIDGLVLKINKRIKFLEPIEKKAERISREWREKNLGEKMADVEKISEYNLLLGDNEEERFYILIACIEKQADQLLRKGLSTDECIDIIERTSRKSSFFLKEGDQVKKIITNIRPEISKIVIKCAEKMMEERKKHKKIYTKIDNDPKRSFVYGTGVTKIEKESEKKPKRNLFKKMAYALTILASVVGIGIGAKQSCSDRSGGSSENAVLSYDDCFDVIDGKDIVSDEYAYDENDLFDEVPIELDFSEINNDPISDIAKDPISIKDFDFVETIPEKSDQVDDSWTKQVIQENDSLYKFFRIWKEKSSMENVVFPEYFKDFTDMQILFALAVYSDAEAIRRGDTDYISISRNLAVRKGRNFYAPYDANVILNILTNQLASGSEERAVLGDRSFEEGFEKSYEGYRKWRGESRRKKPDQSVEGERTNTFEKIETALARDNAPVLNSVDDEWTQMADDDKFLVKNDDLEDEKLIPIDVNDEWTQMADDDKFLVKNDDLEDEKLIPIDVDDEWTQMADDDKFLAKNDDLEDEKLIPIDVDDEWTQMADDDKFLAKNDDLEDEKLKNSKKNSYEKSKFIALKS